MSNFVYLSHERIVELEKELKELRPPVEKKWQKELQRQGLTEI